MGSETKIFNLNSDEFGTNPPFSKKCPAISISQYTFWWEQSEFFLITWREISRCFLVGTGALKNPN